MKCISDFGLTFHIILKRLQGGEWAKDDISATRSVDEYMEHIHNFKKKNYNRFYIRRKEKKRWLVEC